MTTPSREDLLGFVLGALEAEEHQQVTDCLQRHPELQLELQRIKAQLAPLQQTPTPPTDFPVGLARRTCEIVARESRRPCSPNTAKSTNGDSTRSSNPEEPPISAEVPVGRARPRQAVVMVCCAAVLGAALGPMALRFTMAISNSMTLNQTIAALSPIPSSSPEAATKIKNSLRQDSDVPIAMAKSYAPRSINAPSAQGLARQSRAPSLEPGVELISVDSPESAPIASQSIKRIFITDAVSVSPCVGRWNDWRAWTGEGSADNRDSDAFPLVNWIGQQPVSRTITDDSFDLGVRIASN